MAQPFWASLSDISAFGYSESGLLWNLPELAGKTLPGLWSVRITFKRDIEKKKQKGKDGALITDQGDNPTEIEFRGRIFTEEDWNTWQEISPIFFAKKKGAERSPISVVHPQTAAKNITTLYIEELSEELNDQDDVMIVTIKTIEWTARPKEVVAKKVVKGLNTYGPLPSIELEVIRDTSQMNNRMLQALVIRDTSQMNNRMLQALEAA